MPFDQLVRHAGMLMERIDNPLYGTRNHCPGIVDTITHCIAGAHLDRNFILFHQPHQFQTKRHYISVYIRPCNILQMTPRADPLLETITNHIQIMLHRLPPCHFQFHKNVIVRAAYQDTGFFHADFLHQLKILL